MENSDNINELISLIRELQTKVDTLEQAVATLTTQVNKIAYLQKLLDVEITNLTIDDVLQYSNDGKWHNVRPSNIVTEDTVDTGATKLSDLSDVIISVPTNGQALVYSSSDKKWHNNTISSGGSGGGGDISADILKNYLTKAEASSTYFKIAGGTITGEVNIQDDLLVDGGITAYNQ